MSTTFLVPKNDASSTLASGISDSDASLTVASGEGAKFPSTYPFNIRIKDEILQCTNRSTDTLTVTRAQEGTTAVAHASGKAVELVITAKAVSDLNTAVNSLESNQHLVKDADADTSWDVEQSADEDKVHGKVKGVEAFLLHDDGIVDLVKQSSFRAHRESEQEIPINTWTKIQFDHEDSDAQSEYDNATNYRFTAKKAGIYLFNGGSEFRGVQAGDECALMFYKNGSQHQVIWSDHVSADIPISTGSAVIALAANDYVELWACSSRAFNTGKTSATCFFTGIKVA